MSWASIASNQTVSGDNLLNAINTRVFVANFGFIPSAEQMTKINIQVYINVNNNYAPFLAKASNQLVVKSDLQASLNAIGLSVEAEDAFSACLVGFTVNQAVDFTGTLGVGTQIDGVTVSGNSGYFLILSPISHPNYFNVIGINDDGVVIYLENICNF